MGRKRSPQPRRVRHTIAGQFGRRLEQLATAAGLTTAEFARRAGVTEDAIRKFYRGTNVPRRHSPFRTPTPALPTFAASRTSTSLAHCANSLPASAA